MSFGLDHDLQMPLHFPGSTFFCLMLALLSFDGVGSGRSRLIINMVPE
jgi:hypothetical protein